jgi:ketosteroid isomerase-like protein
MPSRARVEDLIARVQRGAILDALRDFYADDVVMQDNANPPTVGLAANLERERAFGATIAQVHECRAPSVVIEGQHVVIHWIFEYTGTDGARYRFDQLAHQTWRGDRIVAERFFYNAAALKAA